MTTSKAELARLKAQARENSRESEQMHVYTYYPEQSQR